MKKHFVIILSVLFSSQMLFAQDPVFYSANNLHLYNNPAMSGMNKSFSVDFGFRNQWPGLSGNYITSATAVNQYLGKGNGVSLMFFTDNAGGLIFKRELDLGYSKRIKLGEGHFIALGVQTAFFRKSLDVDQLNQRAGIYHVSIPERDRINAMDVHTGLLYYNSFLYAGFSVKHLLRPDDNFYAEESQLPMLYFGEVGGKIKLGDFGLVPYVRYRMQNARNTLQTGLKVSYRGGYLEGGTHSNSVYYAGLGYSGKHFRVGYNLTFYELSRQNTFINAHEVFLGFNLNLFKKENEHFFDF